MNQFQFHLFACRVALRRHGWRVFFRYVWRVAIPALFVACNGCMPAPSPAPPVPPRPVPVDAGHAPVILDVYGQACANLAALGCPEGKDPRCAREIAKVVTSGLTPTDPACIAHAPDVVHVRECGAISCP